MHQTSALFRRRLGRTLSRYVAEELVFPILLAFGGLTGLLLAQDLVGLSDLIINRGSGASAVIQIIFHTFLPLATLTLPFAFLIGTLLGLGRLKADCEVLVIEAMGISGRTLLWPVSLIAIVMTIFAFLLTLEIAPYAARSRSQLFQQLVQDNPGVILRPGIVHEFGGSKIVVREISARGDQLRGVLLWMEEDGQTNLIGNTIFAEQATLTPQHNASATLTLLDGVALIPPQQGGGETRFNRFSTTLEGYAIAKDASEDRLARASLASLARLAADPGPSPRLALQAHTEFHRRFASPAACLVFGLLAVALVLQSRQLSRATSGIAGLFVTIAYYGLVQLGEGLAQAQILGVGVSAWLPNITIGSFALLLLYQGELKAKTAWSIGRLTRPAFRPVQRIRFQRALLRARGVVAHYFFEPVRRLCARRYLLSRYIVRQYLQRIRFQRTLLRARGVVAHYFFEPVRRLCARRYLLSRYIARQYLQMLGVAFGLLLVGYFLVDILRRFQQLARYQAESMEVVRFYAARLPLLASRILPMALLLATALTVSLLSAQRELIAVRACGIAASRALAPIFLIAALITPAYFLFNEIVVPQTNALADHLKETQIKDRGAGAQRLEKAIWYRAGTHAYQATQLDPTLGKAQDLSIYELGTNGLPVSRTDARSASYVGQGMWELVDPVRVEISEQGLRTTPAEPLTQLGTTPRKKKVDTKSWNVQRLTQEIREAEAAGYQATAYRVDLHAKLALPLTCLLFPAVVLFFAVHGPPFPGPAPTFFASIILGVSYIVLSDVFISLGYGGFLPPSLAGWSVSGLLSILAVGFALRLKN